MKLNKLNRSMLRFPPVTKLRAKKKSFLQRRRKTKTTEISRRKRFIIKPTNKPTINGKWSKTFRKLNNKQIKQIIKSTKKILYKAVSFGGTTIKNFVVSNEKIGYFKNELKVYGKEDTGCVRYSKINKIKKIVQSGRSTFFCENCQKQNAFHISFKIFLSISLFSFCRRFHIRSR